MKPPNGREHLSRKARIKAGDVPFAQVRPVPVNAGDGDGGALGGLGDALQFHEGGERVGAGGSVGHVPRLGAGPGAADESPRIRRGLRGESR